jgi:hypothetical protein
MLFISFSGYIKAHRLKYRTIFFPNGMVAGVYGTSGNNNDVGVLLLSHLVTYLEQLLHPAFTLAGGILPALYGDAIFQAFCLEFCPASFACRRTTLSSY